MRFYKTGSIKTQFLHHLQIIGRYLEKIKGKMKVFRNFIFLSFYPSKMGKSESKPAYQKGTPIPKDLEGMASVRKTVSVPTGNSAGTVLVYIAVT